MDKKRIDSLWINTKVGEWIKIASEGKDAEANRLYVEIENDIPMNFHNELKSLCMRIADEFNDETEFEEYLKALDNDNYNLVEFIISNGVFDEVYKALNNR